MTAHSSLRLIATTLALTILASTGFAATYIKPDESKELFKLEKIPLQVDSMRELAKHLVVIARRKHDASPANQRATGQLLALAIRLDPANQDARETNEALSSGKHLLPSPVTSLSASKARLRFFSRWLASPEAGNDAKLLSNYLTDATKILKAETANNADLGNWTGIVPSMDKYANRGKPSGNLPKPPKNDRTPTPDRPSEDDETDKGNTPQPPKTPNSDFHLKEQAVSAPFALEVSEKFRNPENPSGNSYRSRRFTKVSSISLNLSPCKPEEKNRLSISTIGSKEGKHSPIHAELGKILLELLTSRHSGLPHYQSKVVISGGNYSVSNGLNLAAPLSLMLESSIANTPLRSDLHICALVDSDGKFTQPMNFWPMLMALRQSSTGGRLIVSPESAKLMIQLLVHGESEFFTRWEVFSASNLDEAMKLSVKQSPEDLAEATQLFESIRNLARKSDVTKLAVNRTVRSRLAQIVSLEPAHISSKILLLQGSGKRSMRLSEEGLAHEILPIVRKMHNGLLKEIRIDKPSASTCKKHHEAAREPLDKLERLVDRSNDDLYQDALRLANDFRRLQTIARRHSGDDLNKYTENKKARALYYTMVRASEGLLSRTLVAAGFPEPEKTKED